MQYNNNNNIEEKLKQLENQSLPDLSAMDDHWQEMKKTILTGKNPAGNSPFSFKIGWKTALAAGCLILLAILSYQWVSQPKKNTLTKTDKSVLPPPVTDTPGHTTILTIKKDSIVINTQKIILPPPKPLLPNRQSAGQTISITNTAIDNVSVSYHSKLEEFFDQLKQPEQLFIINSQKDTIITGAEGSALQIPAHAFAGTGSVNLALKEFYSYSDIVLNRLTTLSDGHQLESGGMIYISATADGKPADLQPGKTIRWFIPDTSYAMKNMQLFTGSLNSSGEIDWKAEQHYFTRSYDNKLSIRNDRITSALKKEKISFSSPARVLVKGTVDTTGNSAYDYYSQNSFAAKDTVFLNSTSGLYITEDRMGLNDSVQLRLKRRFNVDIQTLGWINCDRFYNNPSPRINYVVNLGDTSSKYFSILVFSKIKSMIGGKPDGNKVIFQNVPEGETAQIISIGIENGKPVTAGATIKISRTEFSDLKFETTDAATFRNKTEILGDKR